MKKFISRTDDGLIQMLRNGAVGVLLTDTLYGIVASANNAAAVERVYAVRNRDLHKPCIVLIGSTDQIWDTALLFSYKKITDKYWPGRVSIVLPVADKTPDFVHRGHSGTVAFRLPAEKSLRELLKATGPLIAPSANPAGQTPAQDIETAEHYFGDQVDFYVDSGLCSNLEPSRLIGVTEQGDEKVLR